MKKQKQRSAWIASVPPGLAAKLSLDELRAFESTHAFLTEPIPGPEGIAYHIRGFRYLLFYAAACLANETYPPLKCCRFTTDPTSIPTPSS
jgi:hypothetical protein